MIESIIKRKQNLYSTSLDYVKTLIEDEKKEEALNNLSIIMKKIQTEILNDTTRNN